MSSFQTALQNETLIHHRAEDDAAGVPVRVERTDKQLVDLVLAGDSTAFEAIFDRHKRLVAIIASRFFKRRDEIEEIIQISFAKAFTDLSRFRGHHDRSLSSWLVRITSNACFDTLRNQRRKAEKLDCELSEHEAESLLELTADDSRVAEQGLVDRDLTEKLLAGVADEDRLLLHLLYAEEMSVADIAELLGWSRSNVKIRAWRARAALRKLLRKYL
jgi:RNA polymerase sigma-70 factor (ECF subfamily)